MIWTLVEPGIAISAASLATIRPLLRRWKIRGFTHNERSRGTGAPSQDQGSRAKRMSKMPGFGPQDVTLVDIELAPAHTLSPAMGLQTPKFAAQKISYLPKAFDPEPDEYSREQGSIFRNQNSARREDTKSETFIIGRIESPPSLSDTHITGTWLDQESDGSSIELTGPGNTSRHRGP